MQTSVSAAQGFHVGMKGTELKSQVDHIENINEDKPGMDQMAALRKRLGLRQIDRGVGQTVHIQCARKMSMRYVKYCNSVQA